MSSLEKVRPGIMPRFFSQKMAQKLQRRKGRYPNQRVASKGPGVPSCEIHAQGLQSLIAVGDSSRQGASQCGVSTGGSAQGVGAWLCQTASTGIEFPCWRFPAASPATEKNALDSRKGHEPLCKGVRAANRHYTTTEPFVWHALHEYHMR